MKRLLFAALLIAVAVPFADAQTVGVMYEASFLGRNSGASSRNFTNGAEISFVPDKFFSVGLGFRQNRKYESPMETSGIYPVGNPVGGFQSQTFSESKSVYFGASIQPVRIWKFRPLFGFGPQFGFEKTTQRLSPFVLPGADLSTVNSTFAEQLTGPAMISTSKGVKFSGLAFGGFKFFPADHVVVSFKAGREVAFSGNAQQPFFSFGIGPTF